MEFPRGEAEIMALAVLVAQGLEEAADDFPSPPISAAELKAKLERVQRASTGAVAAESALGEQHDEKDEALKDLGASLQTDLKYAEYAVRDDPEKLKRLGWNVRRGPTPLEPPGEVRNIKIEAEGDTWVILTWKPPAEGGAPGVYRIQRKQASGSWEDIGISIDTKELCSDQPRGVELNYRVFAVNKAGTGQPSATVTVEL